MPIFILQYAAEIQFYWGARRLRIRIHIRIIFITFNEFGYIMFILLLNFLRLDAKKRIKGGLFVSKLKSGSQMLNHIFMVLNKLIILILLKIYFPFDPKSHGTFRQIYRIEY